MAISRALAGAALMACVPACSDPPSSADPTPLTPALAPHADALTFAQVRRADGQVATVLVTRFAGGWVRGIDLVALGAPPGADPFAALAAIGPDRLRRAVAVGPAGRDYPFANLLSPAGPSTRHVATGTNFREHAKEVEIEGVFNFPKFGRATPAGSTVAAVSGALLDYEVEICARFDRAIRSPADFDAAQKGFFLCGDFTDRATLMRRVDPKDIGSGRGFSDAKSGVGFFPTGPFLVIPRDWRAFVQTERITTQVNGDRRQDARGAEMILDFRALAVKALTNSGGRYTFHGMPVPLLAGGKIGKGTALMSGTSAGVVFRPPRLGDLIGGVAAYLFNGPMLRGATPQRVLIERYIAKERAAGRYLKAGDVVRHRSSSMGELQVRIVPPTPARQ
ncbi:2-keto-4-pentenoate hydratase/2-oxohepta-3-ene-1,7-dioic acid hydratase (catechol pathway) [Sphingomonas guangdongensis]|uniref:2-keto-4-pentenoate hydratase/2-oxohepta-3-ene-1,7-dioic acid hydratase (Catechol pathway) n=1 Tax=Sphingomonas guangdongensis TaxID=1141890 RepID=A0A285QAZ8_9SPHN|nr:fumarylacetoacetate hydrolase family protein [Sphingomonas guangdongensis]SOB79100.1 2-keto-4-pentenoate hydratase/2-oxohepta-3-ene-1,7-dioic acid hydratase (catechol pathway) [Sphingomonas guangdongensis]